MGKAAAKLVVGATETCVELRYLSAFKAVDPIVFLQVGRRRILVVPRMEQARAKRRDPRAQVFTPEDLRIPRPRRYQVSEWCVAMLRREGIQQVTVPGTFPVGVADILRRRRIGITPVVGAFLPERAIKRPDELKCLRESQQAAVIAVRAAISTVEKAEIDGAGYLRKDGRKLTSESVRELVSRTLFEHRCLCAETIIAGGEQATDCHETGHGPLRAGEAIVMDIFPRHMEHGYWGDVTRTIVRGEPSLELRALYSAVKAAQSVALARIKPGVRLTSIHQAASEEFVRRGYRTEMIDGKASGFFHGTGHGVGLEVHEAPSLGSAPGCLRKDHVVTVEPGLYYPGLGGVRIEDTVVVTKSGWRYLAPCEKRFQV